MAEEEQQEQQYEDKKKAGLQALAVKNFFYSFTIDSRFKKNVYNNHTLLYISIELKPDKRACIIHVCFFPV